MFIKLRLRLRAIFFRNGLEDELESELTFHLEKEIEENIARGMGPEDARQAALRSFGGVQRVKEESRDERGVRFVEELWQDLRYGMRMLIKQKGVTTIAVLSLALGIGANTALFSVVDAMLLKRLPVNEPERLVLFKSLASREFSAGGYFSVGGYSGNSQQDPVTGQTRMSSFAQISYQRLREQGRQPGSALSDIFAFGNVGLNVLADGRADLASGQFATGNYYRGLGAQPMLGRVLTDEDDQPGAAPVAVLSYRYWQNCFSGDAGVLGKQINLNNRAFTVIGVTPPGFEGAGQVGDTRDITIPLALEAALNADPKDSRNYGAGLWWLRMMGRLQPGATIAQAQAQLENAFQQSAVEHRTARNVQALADGRNAVLPLDSKHFPRLVLASGAQGEMNLRGYYAPLLYLLLGVVSMVLLIACGNVANLLLARVSSRQREIGVRLALGASRGRLLRQLLTESVLLATVGGILGLAFALWIKDGLLAVSDWGGQGMRALDPRLDWRVLVFTVALSFLTGIVFGLAPAWRATQMDLTPTLKDSGRGSSAASRSWLSRGLVVAQVALSLMLLIGAGLFVRTLVNLQRVDLGFNTKNLLIFNIVPGLLGYRDEGLQPLYDRLMEKLDALPGVSKVTFTSKPLLAQDMSNQSVYLRSALTAAPDANGSIKATGSTHVLYGRENMLETLEIPLMAGRTFNRQDDERRPKVVVVNQTFALKYFHNESLLGKQFTFDAKKPDEFEIIGLVKDARFGKQRDDIRPTAYLPWGQHLSTMRSATVEMRIAGDPQSIIAAVRQAMREVDPNLPLSNIKTQVEQADETLRVEQLFAKLVTLFGLLAQQLASIGLFGVLAHAVSQRTQEIGIRLALGASPSDVLKMVIKQGMVLSVIGIVVGSAGAYALTRYLESWMQLSKMLYGVKSTDPMTYGVIILLIMVVAMVACYMPARRATTVDPLITLRHE